MIDDAGIAKAMGAVSGTVIALLFAPPRTLAGFFRRTVVALVCAWIFAEAMNESLVHYFEFWKLDLYHLSVAAAVIAIFAWPAVGSGTRIVQGFKKTQQGDDS